MATPPPAEPSSLPPKSDDAKIEAAVDQAPTPSPRLAHLDTVAATTAAPASASSPSNDMSPAHQPTESSRHSTPATSAAGSDHAQSTPASTEPSTSSTKLPVDAAGEQQPTTEDAPQPSTSSSSQAQSEPEQPHDDHPLASVQPAYFYPCDATASSAHDGIPVFEPTMQQFRDFYAYCQAIDSWGMQYGIVKITPPKEWRESLPDLRPSAKQSSTSAEAEEPDQHADISKVRIRNAIMQHFTPAGSGVWRQINTTRSAKIWNAKQWADLCLSPEHKGPEMYRMKWKVDVDGVSNGGWGPKNIGAKDASAASSSILEKDGVRTRSGKARPSLVPAAGESKSTGKRKRAEADHEPHDKPVDSANVVEERTATTPPAPTSPSSPGRRSQRIVQNTTTVKETPPLPSASRDASSVKPKKNWEAEATTHEEWCGFDYQNCWRREALSTEQLAQLDGQPAASTSKLSQPSSDAADDAAAPAQDESSAEDASVALPSPTDWTPEVCREIESEYWRSLNFGKPPMYGADLSGTLFDHRTKHWNVGKLDSVLTRLRLRRKLPGVNTPYLYWGMWRATFAWHVEDMDLYSINYIHFGAPKQWYAIRQADRQRFESAMAGAFPSDARRCPHFMRHKSYLASPSFLASHGIRPLKLVQNAGEFVITYPYGYHSGFNLGYNCAESVNFALESWLDIGRKASYCHCDQSQNSVRIDVDALLEESKEMEELERKRELRRAKEEAVHAIEEEEMEKRRIRNDKAKERRKLKKEADEAAAAAAGPALPVPFQGGADFYIDPKQAGTSPCVFCPADVHTDLVATPAEIESTNSKLTAMAARHAHRLCASFVPETWVGKQGKAEVVCGIEGIDKARFSLKCQICPNPSLQKLYPKIQCTRGKCPRSAHVSCALVEEHGWFVDVCPAETADRLEGKKASTTTSAPQTDGLEDGERLVVLCKTHNPLFREAEEARKAEELRERIYALPIPSMVKIKTAGGMFQALMVEIHEEGDEIVIEDEGRPSTVKFQQIIFDSASAAEDVKQEPAVVALLAGTDAGANGGGDAPPPNKRRRKASEKASANAKAASEEAVEASLAVSDAAMLAASVKRPRKSRTTAALAVAAGAADAPNETTAAQSPANGEVKPKPKRQRQSKKKAQAVEVAEAITTPPPPSEMHHQAPLSWPGHPMQQQQRQQQQPQQAQQAQQAQPSHVPSKRGPRATYAAQPPTASQPPQYSERYAHSQQQQQHYPGSDYGPMQHRGHAMNGDAAQYAAQHATGYPSGYGRGEYAASPSYAHAHAHAHPHSQQQQQLSRASNGSHSYGAAAPSPYAPYGQPGGAHPSYAAAGADGGSHGRHLASSSSSSSSPATPSVLSSSSPCGLTSASQYGYLAAPPAGYRDRSPPLPTYAKPMAHQPHLSGSSEMHAKGYPDYRPPYNHGAPPGFLVGYSGQFAPQQQYRAHHPSQQHQQHQPQQGQQYADVSGYAYHYPSQPQPSAYEGQPPLPQQHRQQHPQHQQHPMMSPGAHGAYGYPAHPHYHPSYQHQPQTQQPAHQQQ
ncbi:related to RPH1-Transcriptional repressor of PHR1 [Sporisorium reilianum SRZ2]|uniref:[histone H3]-trimethyl-L-lysine(9) demethylase n=1 Tax=Sporisorium reilianum (strain SRZ2) TaxID=999809 RepID=E6ZRK5_SPORE|nr:related to RPH1-Transcriptional repressor of PHR1 [Sporisorium reilianum SRZ2]